jgi:hypothetical protein
MPNARYTDIFLHTSMLSTRYTDLLMSATPLARCDVYPLASLPHRTAARTPSLPASSSWLILIALRCGLDDLTRNTVCNPHTALHTHTHTHTRTHTHTHTLSSHTPHCRLVYWGGLPTERARSSGLPGDDGLRCAAFGRR